MKDLYLVDGYNVIFWLPKVFDRDEPRVKPQEADRSSGRLRGAQQSGDDRRLRWTGQLE